jgi:hypothetical protein
MNAFHILRLDATQYDPQLQISGTVRQYLRGGKLGLTDLQTTRIREAFFDKSSSPEGPFFTAREVRDLCDELDLETADLRRYMKKELEDWLRSVAVLRRQGVVVDYASILHLSWLA